MSIKKEIIARVEEIYYLKNLKNILYWDLLKHTMFASKSKRLKEIDILEKRILERWLDPSLYKLIEQNQRLNKFKDQWEQENHNLIKSIIENYKKTPIELINSYTKISAITEQDWLKAKEKNDFNLVADSFSHLVMLAKDIGKHHKSSNSYEYYLQKYDEGRTVQEINDMMGMLKPIIKDLINSSSRTHNIESEVNGYNLNIQKANKLAQFLGFDLKKGRIDSGEFPFCGGCPGDVRLLVDYRQGKNSFYKTIHEIGHGLYEQNLPQKYQDQPVGKARSLMIHELCANIYEHHFSREEIFREGIQKKLGISKTEAQNYYTSYNSLNLSAIRLNSDEISFQAHILMRYEIERKLFNSEIKVTQIPALWNELSFEYFGYVPKNLVEGCLQDVHWYRGMFGYFPSYTVSAIFANQYYEHYLQNNKNPKTESLNRYLANHIWKHGSLKKTQNILLKEINIGRVGIIKYKTYLENKIIGK